MSVDNVDNIESNDNALDSCDDIVFNIYESVDECHDKCLTVPPQSHPWIRFRNPLSVIQTDVMVDVNSNNDGQSLNRGSYVFQQC